MLTKIVAQYLEKDEAFDLKTELDNAGIECIAKRHGLPRLFGGFINYQVQVDKKDFLLAKPLVDSYLEKRKLERKELIHQLSTQCPQCGSKNIGEKKDKSFLEKIFYVGVTIWTCKECGGMWYT